MAKVTTEQRFWAKVQKTDTCWLWTAAKNVYGYGMFGLGNGKWGYAHRFAYELLVGPIPKGLQIDHLCRVRACVRPDHLEPVTVRENLMRGETHAAANVAKTHCPKGHPYDEANTYVAPSGRRRCLICKREQGRIWMRGYKPR